MRTEIRIDHRLDYRLILAGTLATAMGCLPSPDIHVPDFSSPPPVDASVPAADLRVTGDAAAPADMAAPLRWMSDARGLTIDTVRAVWVGDVALNEAYAVGQNGLILHRSGGIWTKEVVDGTPITTNLYAVAALAADTVYAVGEAGVILRRSGGKWMREGNELGTTMNLFGVTALTGGEVIVVGDAGTIARRQLSNIYIAEDTTAIPTASLRAVSGATLDTLYAVGPNSTIVRRVMGKWQADTLPIDAGDKGNYLAVTQNTEGVFVAGEYGRVLRRDTTKWVREATVAPVPMMPNFYGLATVAADLFAVGASGAIQRRDGATKTWSVEPTVAAVNLYGVAGVGPAVLTVGEQGTLLRRM